MTHSDQTIPWTICRSVRRCVSWCVGLSSALWKNGGSDPDAVRHHRSDGSRDEAGSGYGDRSTRRGTFGGEFGVHHCNQCGLYSVGVRQCFNRRRCIWGGACGGPRYCCIRWGSTLSKGKGTRGGFEGFLYSIFAMGNAIGLLTVKCFRFVCENLTTFPFRKRIVGKLD